MYWSLFKKCIHIILFILIFLTKTFLLWKDLEILLQIHIRRKLVTEDGIYSIKLGYNVAVNQKFIRTNGAGAGAGAVSSSSTSKPRVLNLNAPPKIRHFFFGEHAKIFFAAF